MSEEFDISAAQDRQDAIIRDVQWIRDGISQDIIDYYYSTSPQSAEKEREYRNGMRQYLKTARGRIDDLLNGKLYD